MTDTLLLEYFDDLLVTPENAEQLNRAILSMAANGKLTLQNPNDEPASEFLKRIYATKHDGASKEKSEKKKEAQELPHGWAFATIGDLVSQNGVFIDGDWVESKDQDPEGEVRLTQLADVGDGIYRNRSNRFMTQEKANKLGCTFLEPNDVLIARMPDPLGRACLFPGDPKPCVTVVDVCVVRVGTDNIDSKWLMYAINSPDFRISIDNLKTGTTRQRISRGNLATLPLKVPPIAEQKRIVARVEELFAQTRALAKELAHSQIELDSLNKSALSQLLASETPEEINQHWDFIAKHFDLLFQIPEHVAPLRQSILELAVRGKLTRREAGDESAKKLLKRILTERRKYFDDKSSATKNRNKASYVDPAPPNTDDLPNLANGWLWVRAEQVCGFITKGTTPSAEKLFSRSGDIPFLKVYNLTDRGDLDFSINPTFVSRATHEGELARSRVLPGDVLMNIVGPPLGKVSIVPDTYPEWNINQAIVIFRPFNGLIKEYLCLMLLENSILGWANRQGKGTAGQSNLTLEICRNLPLPLPPVAEQERIVKRVEQLLSLCDALEARLQSAEEERGRLVRAVMAGVGNQ